MKLLLNFKRKKTNHLVHHLKYYFKCTYYINVVILSISQFHLRVYLLLSTMVGFNVFLYFTTGRSGQIVFNRIELNVLSTWEDFITKIFPQSLHRVQLVSRFASTCFILIVMACKGIWMGYGINLILKHPVILHPTKSKYRDTIKVYEKNVHLYYCILRFYETLT